MRYLHSAVDSYYVTVNERCQDPREAWSVQVRDASRRDFPRPAAADSPFGDVPHGWARVRRSACVLHWFCSIYAPIEAGSGGFHPFVLQKCSTFAPGFVPRVGGVPMESAQDTSWTTKSPALHHRILGPARGLQRLNTPAGWDLARTSKAAAETKSCGTTSQTVAETKCRSGT